MKINIRSDNFEKVIVTPEYVYFVGITVKFDYGTLEVLNSNLSTNNEEIILDENLKIILHYYDSPEALEIKEAFKDYIGFECVEVNNKKFSLNISI